MSCFGSVKIKGLNVMPNLKVPSRIFFVHLPTYYNALDHMTPFVLEARVVFHDIVCRSNWSLVH